MKNNKNRLSFLCAVLALIFLLGACTPTSTPTDNTTEDKITTDSEKTATDTESAKESEHIDITKLPAYSGSPYTVVNGNIPNFSSAELTTKSYEKYAPLDSLGRCGVTIASIGRDIMPTEDRGSIGSVKPTGWHTVRYDNVDGKYLYNRCHLIGFQLTGENANTRNLITGTRYMNVDGMLPFENMVADFIRETGEHVLYRVTPVFYGDELVCRGVAMEAMSVEDEGDSICFFVYCYNVQPDVDIDYATGESRLSATTLPSGEDRNGTFILNTNSKKIHKPTCSYAKSISDQNRRQHTGNIADLLKEGYEKAGCCF